MLEPGSRELLRRAAHAEESLADCRLCERRCGVDRRRKQAGLCGLGATSRCFKRHLSFAEELELLPSYMVYLSGCNFRCLYCAQAPRCLEGERGRGITPEGLAGIAWRALQGGARTINLVGGEPSIHVHTIMRMAAGCRQRLPLVLNSNMYMTPEVLGWLDGVVWLYLADFKYGDDRCAKSLSGVDNYLAIVTRNLLLAAGQGRVLVRHLLLPGHVECCFRPLARWMGANLPAVPVHVMGSYVQSWRSAENAQLRRLVGRAEVAGARAWARKAGMREYGGKVLREMLFGQDR